MSEGGGGIFDRINPFKRKGELPTHEPQSPTPRTAESIQQEIDNISHYVTTGQGAPGDAKRLEELRSELAAHRTSGENVVAGMVKAVQESADKPVNTNVASQTLRRTPNSQG